MAKDLNDLTTRTLLRKYRSAVRKHLKSDRWIGAHAGQQWHETYKYKQQLRSYTRERVLDIADILRERGVYLG